ncbi:MAG: CoA-binding protein [Planctomycetes bacterium]|nr:CoA-binding protein [Planctomycetota bacterium]
MRQLKTRPFPYYVGIHSLEELITRDSRVCVVNILGTESRKVTPVSHAYSGGNVVAGVQYGRTDKLETPLGDIPVYPSVREVMKRGHHFDVGVIYLPPSAVAQAASELVSFNDALKRIVIITEKVATRDSRNIRFLCQEAGVDVIGCNCLGVANAWDHVRIGGALGGDHPEETLRAGSVAIHSNSGNFTTTIAEYLRTAGFGLSTVVSSGKDVYIHFALAEFLYAAQNDPRTKAVALYAEPGGYYEQEALRMIQERHFGFNKPIVVCVTGRWKKDLLKACGHAGALAGSGDDALSKERWFDEYFGTPVFDPEHPVVSKRGVRIPSIQAFPTAMKAVFQAIDEKPDFAAEGDLSLKLWLRDTLLPLPEALEIPLVTPLKPYDEQLALFNKQVGAQFLRQNMRNTSGASRMDPTTQVAELNGTSILELAERTLEENIFFALARVKPQAEDVRRTNLLLNLFLGLEAADYAVVERARAAHATPNAYLAGVTAALGDPPALRRVREHTRFLIDTIREFSLDEQTARFPEALDAHLAGRLFAPETPPEEERLAVLYKEVRAGARGNIVLRLARHALETAEKQGVHLRDPWTFLVAALATATFWRPLLHKRLSRQTVEDATSYLQTIARMVACSVIDRPHNKRWAALTQGDRTARLTDSFTENAFWVLFNRAPNDVERIEFKYLIGLTLTNGPGTLSAKGAKESVSARNHISMAFVGFLANTGLSHGGNGFEAVEYLLERFRDTGLKDPGSPDHGLDLKALAAQAAKDYAVFKRDAKRQGALRVKPIPCINHPVFKGSPVNIDPREDFIRKQCAERKIYNVFQEWYHRLVEELFHQGVTPNVFCVNIDAVLAVISLKLVWKDLQDRTLTLAQLQELVFDLFLFGRMVGVAAEIIDHRDRGTDLDCRTPLGELKFVL